jgi:hypothetical protein
MQRGKNVTFAKNSLLPGSGMQLFPSLWIYLLPETPGLVSIDEAAGRRLGAGSEFGARRGRK